jgi:quercetin dioxygenase-like cupin family protein
MTTETIGCAKKKLGSPDITRKCDHGKLELVTVEETTLARVTLQPGWKWSESVDTEKSCQAHHLQYVVSGRLSISLEDGSRMELEPGDFASIAPGHDAQVVGNEPFVAIDFSADVKQYAQQSGTFFD